MKSLKTSSENKCPRCESRKTYVSESMLICLTCSYIAKGVF